MNETQQERSKTIRIIVWFLYFILSTVLIFSVIAEIVNYYYTYGLAGEELIKADRAIDFWSGQYLLLPILFVVFVFTARWSVKGILPGTGKLK